MTRKMTIETHGQGMLPTTCNVAMVVAPSEQTVIIVTELEDNQGLSITNAAEILFVAITRFFGVRLHNVVWIEHYTHEEEEGIDCTWELVTFKCNIVKGILKANDPDWRAMTPDDWQEIGLKPRQVMEL